MKIIIYKILALISLGAALALGLIVLHFSLASTDIIITANQVPVHIEEDIELIIQTQEALEEESLINVDELQAELSEIAQLRGMVLDQAEENENIETTALNLPILAKLDKLPINVTLSLDPEGEGKEVPGIATGMVTIYNEMSFSQGLIATTRLLTPDDKLFRIKEGVTIPAGDKVAVEAYADQVGPSGNIGPTSFTIPGLSPARQKQVYAKSEQPFAGGLSTIKILTNTDFTRAREAAESQLIEQALEEFSKVDLPTTSANIYLSNTITTSSDNPGDEKNSVTVTSSAMAYALSFNKEVVLAQIKQALDQSLSQNQSILAFNEESFSYTIINIDDAESTAKLQAYLEGFATLQSDTELIDTRELVGLSVEEIQNRLLTNDAIQEVQVKFSPFWVSRAPRRPDKIKLIIK